jgi:putative peptide zinc metalloprotease protein
VQIQPRAVEKVFVPVDGGILEKLEVRNGQEVQKGDVLARFTNLDLSQRLEEARSQVEVLTVQLDGLQEQANKNTDVVERGKIVREMARLQGQRAVFAESIPLIEQKLRDLDLKAPRAGVVFGVPELDEVGKSFELDPDRPLCSIGDPGRLRVLVPVSPIDYNLLKEDLEQRRREASDLAVTIRVPGRGARTWAGKVTHLPESEARDVPPALTTKYGGPLAFRPDSSPNSYVPVSQQYLVGIDVLAPDAALCPGTLAQVKIHCNWRPAAWWVVRTISSTFELGLF